MMLHSRITFKTIFFELEQPSMYLTAALVEMFWLFKHYKLSVVSHILLIHILLQTFFIWSRSLPITLPGLPQKTEETVFSVFRQTMFRPRSRTSRTGSLPIMHWRYAAMLLELFSYLHRPERFQRPAATRPLAVSGSGPYLVTQF